MAGRLRRGLLGATVGTGGPQQVVAVRWRGLPYPSTWQQIGAYDLPPGNNVISIYPGPQRRNGYGDVSSRLNINIAGLGNYPPTWVQQYPLMTPGSQRSTGAPPVQGPNRYRVFKMRRAVLAAQVVQSGPELVPFLKANQSLG